MPVQFQWFDDEHHTIFFKFTTPWTIAEFMNANREAGALVAALDYIVDAIFDMTEASFIPNNALSSFISAAKQTESAPNEGLTLVIGSSIYMQRLADVVIKLTRQHNKIRVVKNTQEAQDIITQMQAQRRLVNVSESTS